MEPSPDRKRKRSALEADLTEIDSAGEMEEKSMSRPSPTEEEVEEFFAILRRIHERSDKGKSSHSKITRIGRRTGELSSKPVLVNGGSSGKLSKAVGGAGNGVIDLNAVPEDAN